MIKNSKEVKNNNLENKNKKENQVRKNSKNVQKTQGIHAITVLAAILFIAIIVGAVIFAINIFKQETQQPIKPVVPKIDEVISDITSSNQENVIISDLKITSSGSQIEVSGNLKNNGSDIRKLELTLYLYDNVNESRIRGISSVTIDDIKLNETKSFKINIMGNYSDLKNYEVKISSVQR